MVSASRLAVAFKAGPGVFDAWRRNLHLHTPQDPYILCLTASPANPSYALRIRKSPLNTRAELLTDKQKVRLFKAFTANEAHAVVEVTYGVYQRLIAAYEASGKREGKIAMYKLLKSIRVGVPTELPELAQLGRSLWKRHREILAYFDVGASNGAVEAINSRLEHLRGISLGFRNLKQYILRSLIHSGRLQDRINAL